MAIIEGYFWFSDNLLSIIVSIISVIFRCANLHAEETITWLVGETVVCSCIVDIYIVPSSEFISSIANVYRPYLNSLLLVVYNESV